MHGVFSSQNKENQIRKMHKKKNKNKKRKFSERKKKYTLFQAATYNEI